MEIIEKQCFDEERALYGRHNMLVKDCRFDGPADGESAFKEGAKITVENSFFNLRYPFWHDHGLTIRDSEMTELCRAALWYSDNVSIERTKMHGIKALRECSNVVVKNCDIISPEFGWSTKNIQMEHSTAESEYFLMRSQDVLFRNVVLKGKYSFQYIENGVFKDCRFDTKDAFWHSKNVTVKNSIVKGEYLAWYSENLTLVNCRIVGTQPFCYCKNLRLINCEMIGTDLCFEKSDVHATITTPVISIKNPLAGTILVPAVETVIQDDPQSHGEIIIHEIEKASGL